MLLTNGFLSRFYYMHSIYHKEGQKFDTNGDRMLSGHNIYTVFEKNTRTGG